MIPALPRTWSGAADGPVIVFANSLGTVSRMWDGILARVATDHRVLTFELPGHLPTAEGPFGFEDIVVAATAVLDEEDVRGATVVGVSLGGALGIRFAADRPERVARLVTISTPVRQASREFWFERAEAVERDGLAPIAAGMRERWFPTGGGDAVLEDFLRLTPAGYAAACRALADLDVAEALPRVAAPTLVITALDDASVPPGNAAEIASRVSDSVLWPVEEGGHLIPVRRPDLVAALVRAFEASRPTG